MTENRGFRRIAGAWGTLHIDGEAIFEVVSFEASVEVQRGDVQIGINVDSKMTGLAGSGQFVVKHVYTRGIEKYLSAVKAGRDPRFLASVCLDDPDSVGGQLERINIGNYWINNLPLTNFHMAEVVE